jgi:hypothetical protein
MKHSYSSLLFTDLEARRVLQKQKKYTQKWHYLGLNKVIYKNVLNNINTNLLH